METSKLTLYFLIAESILLSKCAIAEPGNEQPTILNLSTGRILGKVVVTAENNSGRVFLAIPYAEPPIGELRYANAVPKTPWEGVWNCTEYGYACMSSTGRSRSPQHHIDEDCLTMNVFVPMKCAPDNPCPIIHHIHASAHNWGSPRIFDVDWVVDKFVSSGVIFATVGYRLGSFAFWNTGDDIAVGNYGIYDMVESLRWLQREIHAFGGNASAVTIMGYSSSGVDVSSFTLSPKTKGLFQQAIAMSGSAVSAAVFNDNELACRLLAINAGCATNETWASGHSAEILNCMRQKSATDLLQIQRTLDDKDIMFIGPRIDGLNGLFPASGIQMTRTRHPFPYLIGGTHDEMAVLKLAMPNASSADVQSECEKASASYFNFSQTKAIGRACVENYAKRGLQNFASQVGEIDSDGEVFVPNFLDAYSMVYTGAPVYMYSFDYVKKGLEFLGAVHAADLTYLLGQHLFKFNADDEAIARTYPTYFTNFAKFGNPTPSDGSWKQFNPSIGNYYSISVPNKSKNKLGYHSQAVKFWTVEAPTIEKVLAKYNTKLYQNLLSSNSKAENQSSVNWQLAFWIVLAVAIVILLVLVVTIIVNAVKKNTISKNKETSADEQTPLLR